MTIQKFTPDSTGSTASRPVAPDVGWRHYNTDTNEYEFFDGSSWLTLSGSGTGTLSAATGSFLSDNTDGRTILTGIPGGSVLIRVEVLGLNNNSHELLTLGNSTTTFTGTGSVVRAANAQTLQFSGVNFTIGSLSANAGVSNSVGWTIIFRNP